MHDLLFAVGIMCLMILLLIVLLKKLNQPYIIAYILAGVLLGPHVTGVFKDPASIASLGEFGILLLMFFLGVEINIPDKKSLLLQPVLAQGAKILVVLLLSACLCRIMNWPASTIALITIFLTFNSTAVVSEVMRQHGELQTSFGTMVLNMLLLQDILLAPVMTLFQVMGSQDFDTVKFMAAALGSLLIFLMVRAIRNRNLLQLPFFRSFQQDHEMQVFAGAFICLGFAILAGFIGLSGPVGSFTAGILIGRTRSFAWLETALRPFRIFFVALFFMSIGIMLDLNFIHRNLQWVLVLTLATMLIHSSVTTFVFRALKFPWKKSLYAGALLSQTGELGILACSVAFSSGIIDEQLYKTGLTVTALSLLCASFWVKFNKGWLLNSTTTSVYKT